MKLSEEQIAKLFLAYHDGTLNVEDKQLLDAYLLVHPENAQDLTCLQLPIHTEVSYTGPALERAQLEKIAIYAAEDGHPFEKLAIGNLEGLLNKEEVTIEAGLAKDQLYLDIKQKVELTKLTPNAQIVYPFQARLIKEVKFRSLPLKKYVYWTSAAAAVFISVLIATQNASETYSKQHNNQALVGKKPKTAIEVEPTSHTKNPSNPTQRQVVITHPHIVDPEPRDCIVAVQDLTENTVQLASHTTEIIPDNNQSIPTEFTQPENTNLALQNQTPSTTFRKEPVTVKTFLLQKTNERLFGTPAPSPDVRYETIARYASQTIGLPVRYEVESGAASDKVVFQLGPISIERNRSKK